MHPRTYHPPLPADSWTADFLGGSLRARGLPLPPTSQGEAEATLIHHAPAARENAKFAILYVHGWSDYFFNREMAEFFTAIGAEFYAVDLHASGRSLRPHQVPAFVPDLREYFADLDAATHFIRGAHPQLPLVLLAHSQGGLTAALWAKEHPVDGLILNAPWLDQPRTSALRTLLTPIVEIWGRCTPLMPIPIRSPRLYERVISNEFEGEWPINADWRPDPSHPTRPGWARAVFRAQSEVSRGLGITAPILVLTSHGSLMQPVWHEEMRSLDGVTDVHQTWRQVPRLGSNYELVKIRGAIHDVLLSPPPVRSRAYAHIAAWLGERFHLAPAKP